MHWTVFIRQEISVPLEGEESVQLPDSRKSIETVPSRRADIHAALKVLGRRDILDDDPDQVIDLNMTNLDGALLQGAD